MNARKINWPLYAGILLNLFAFLSYPFLFVTFPGTRDFPWANLFLFAVADALMALGIRRAFVSDQPHPRRAKIVAGLLSTLSFVIFGLFIFGFFVLGRALPASHGAPQVGQKAPDFSLSDSSGQTVSLAELLSTPSNGRTPRGVLLVFYRGYW